MPPVPSAVASLPAAAETVEERNGGLYEITPFDVTSYAGTALVLLAVAALAAYFPARRAVRIDPVIALRE